MAVLEAINWCLGEAWSYWSSIVEVWGRYDRGGLHFFPKSVNKCEIESISSDNPNSLS
jgi:hypothetical protein